MRTLDFSDYFQYCFNIEQSEPTSTEKAMVEINHLSQDTIWLQISSDCLNLSYPSSLPPLELLTEKQIQIPKILQLDEWQPSLFITFDMDTQQTNSIQIKDIIHFLHNYIEKILIESLNIDNWIIDKCLLDMDFDDNEIHK